MREVLSARCLIKPGGNPGAAQRHYAGRPDWPTKTFRKKIAVKAGVAKKNQCAAIKLGRTFI